MNKVTLAFFISSLSLNFFLSSCTEVSQLISPTDISNVKRIQETEAKQCTSLSENLQLSQSHSFHQDDNLLKLLKNAKIKTAKKDGDAFLVKSLSMDPDHNSAKIVYQIFSCSK